MKIFISGVVFFCFSFLSFSQIHPFQTTRLKATAGTGIGSLLMNESAVLNPAAAAFFKGSSIYAQRSWLELQNPSNRPFTADQFKDDSHQTGFIFADSKKNLKGTAAYITQQEGFNKRRRISSSLSALINEFTSFGILYHNTKDEFYRTSERKYHQWNLGLTRIIGKKLTAGIIFNDIFKSNPTERQLAGGFQYTFSDILSFMGDLGYNFSRKFSESLFYRAALQITFFDDFFLRGGYSYNKDFGEKTLGVGLSWVAPKLIVSAALNEADFLQDPSFLQANETLKDISLSLAVRF